MRADTAEAPIPVRISGRHVHLCRRTIQALFGKDYALRAQSPLAQPGQFACEETVALVGPEGRLAHVRVLGPPRSEDQIELSRTDARLLGLDAPLRLSGDLCDTPGILIEGPAGRVYLDRGVVRALRHIHMSPAEAERLGVQDHEVVQVAVNEGGRRLIFDDVVVRVAASYRLECHLDSDEGNAAGIADGALGWLIRRSC